MTLSQPDRGRKGGPGQGGSAAEYEEHAIQAYKYTLLSVHIRQVVWRAMVRKIGGVIIPGDSSTKI